MSSDWRIGIRALLIGIKYRNNIKGSSRSFRVCKNTKLKISHSARIVINNYLVTNSNDGFDNGRTSIFRLDDNSVLKSDEFTFLYGADVILFENSELLLGKIVF